MKTQVFDLLMEGCDPEFVFNALFGQGHSLNEIGRELFEVRHGEFTKDTIILGLEEMLKRIKEDEDL